MSKFQRPADLAFPLVYRTFTARDGENCESVEYRIQDLLESDYERAVELMARDFASEESLCLCRGVCDDAEALEEIKSSWRRGLAGRISVGCYDNRDELVGVTILAVHEKGFGEGAAEFKTAIVRDIFSSLFHIESQHEVFDKYSTDKYLTDYGMVTDKRFRQRGIGTEFLKARAAILKSLNLQVTSSAFTVIGSQKAAVKANYVECYSIKWTEVGEKFPAFDFSIATVDCCKIMDMTV